MNITVLIQTVHCESKLCWTYCALQFQVVTSFSLPLTVTFSKHIGSLLQPSCGKLLKLNVHNCFILLSPVCIWSTTWICHLLAWHPYFWPFCVACIWTIRLGLGWDEVVSYTKLYKSNYKCFWGPIIISFSTKMDFI